MASLPRDLVIAISYEELRELVLIAMSLADRPRPTLLQVRSILKGQLFTFVWLPREELTTARRTAIAMLLENEVGREITSWSVELGDGDLALIRYTQYIDEKAPPPDSVGLDAAIVEMVRGWAPAVEGELIDAAGVARATRLAITYINSFPDGYRARTAPEEGAADILRLAGLADENDRAVRISRLDQDAARHLRLKTYRRGGLIPLSDVVPVLENFGFRVLEEFPTALSGGNGYIHDFRVEVGAEAEMDQIVARTAEDRARDRQRALRHGGGRRVQPARALCRARHAARGVAARLVPLPAPDRKQLRPRHRRRCSSPRPQRDAGPDRPVRRCARSRHHAAR